LGDGDLEKNHVHVYHKLLETIASGLPTAEVLDFGHPRHQLDETSVWKAAIAQLIVSLFPTQFLPEILGFNLHFEAISMETLKAGKELKEVGIDPYYFILHISIDNASSGHSAIAVEVVCEYMDYILRVEGEKAAQKAWEKLQAGYLLSLGLPGTTVCPSRKRPIDGSDTPPSPTEMEVIRIFKAKAQVVHGIHCNSRLKIGSRSVADWLDPVALESKKWQMALLDALSCSKYWICRGDSSKSRFIQELQWNGRMFGAFTQNEYDALRRWVDGLPSTSLALECLDAGENIDSNDDILSGYPVFQPAYNSTFLETSFSSLSATTLFSFQSLPSLAIGSSPIVESFLPLWLTHPCLLQGFVSVPFRTKSKLACTIIKILRAQGGFDIEQECVAGMCEVRRSNSLGLAEIGMNMMAQNGFSRSALPSLKHVLHAWPSKFAIHMLHLSMRPLEYKGLLIGMATAFAKMHTQMAKSGSPLLSVRDQDNLQKVAFRELEGLEVCWKEIKPYEKLYAECCKGYLVARHEIEKCFQS
jgi:Iron-containing redox enzyme